MDFKQLTRKLASSQKPLLAVLIDPDKFNPELVRLCEKSRVSCFLVGGSKLYKGNIHKTIAAIKTISKIPVEFFFLAMKPSCRKRRDGLLLLSLLSGRNPEYLIEKHIAAAPVIKKMKLPYLSTAYLLIDGGRVSTTQAITKNTGTGSC